MAEKNAETVALLNQLKGLLGLKFDKELADRYNMTKQDMVALKGSGLSKFTKGILKELIRKLIGESPE